jgi:RNA polymerase sigma-70 factor (ECF subfamily)
MGATHRPDADLLASGAAEDFGRFYDRHLRAVVAFVGARMRTPELIFDVAAETFARALENRETYDPAKGPAIAWLLGIARNLIVDAARRGRVESESRRRLGIAPVQLDDEQLTLIAERARVDLRAALASMPATQREAVFRRVVLEESYTEIAGAVRCSEQVVRKRVSRGLAALRSNLEAER